MKKFLSLGLALLLLLTIQGCTTTDTDNENNETIMIENKNMDLEEEYLQALSDAIGEQNRNQTSPLVDNADMSSKKDGSDALGSCDTIEENSSCIEYYGSFWTTMSAKLSCGEEGTFSTDPCPRDFAGGCNTGMGTDADMVIWMYTRGGGDIDKESLKYAKMACDATLISQWIE